MKNLSRYVAALAIGFAASPVFAADAIVSYRGVVVSVQGPQADALPVVGQQIEISYTIDPTVADFRPEDPTSGVYFYAVRNLTVSLPGVGFQAVASSGSVQTYNLPDLDDLQVYCYNDGIVNGATIGGFPVFRANLYLSEFESPPDPTKEPGMLTSDAMPLIPVVGANYKNVTLTTSAGSTAVLFDLNTDPTVGELVVDGKLSIAGFVSSGAIKSGIGGALTSKLSDIVAAFAAGNTAQACLAWQGFSDQVKNLPPMQITADAKAQLNALATALGEELGGC